MVADREARIQQSSWLNIHFCKEDDSDESSDGEREVERERERKNERKEYV